MPVFAFRLLLGLAVLSAGCALALPAAGLWPVALAVVAALGAVWVRNLPAPPAATPREPEGQAGPKHAPESPRPSSIDPRWLSLLHDVAQTLAKTTTLDEAMHAVSALLAHGLDAQDVSAWQVVSAEGDVVELRALMESGAVDASACLSMRAEWSGVAWAALHQRLRLSAVRSVAASPPVSTPGTMHGETRTPQGFSGACDAALPVTLAGRALAVLELQRLPYDIDDPLLPTLLETVRHQLNLLAERDAARRVRVAPSAEAHEFLTPLLRKLPISLYVFDAVNHRVLSLNGHAEAEFGRPRERVVGQRLDDAFGLEVSERLESCVQQALAQTQMIEREFGFSTPQGPRRVSVRFVALRADADDSFGEARSVIALARDVTHEREAERELQESQARFREFAEAVDDSLFVTNPARDHFRFLSTVKYPGLTRWTRENFDVDPGLLQSVIDPQDHALLSARRRQEMRLKPTDTVLRIRHPVLGMRWVRSRTSARRMADGSISVYGMATDVTAERERQIVLQQARDAAELASQDKASSWPA